MHAKLQRRIQRYGWDKAVVDYEPGWKESLADAHAELLRIANAQAGEHVLDLACGTGLVTLPLAVSVGPAGRVTATDISEEMIVATRRAATEQALSNVYAYRSDAESVELMQDCSVDAVTCALGLMYVPHPARVLAEAWRVLKPGGRAVMAVWGERSRCGWAEIFPIVDARVKSSVCPHFFRLGTGTALSKEMELAGFADVSQSRILSELPYASPEAAVKAAFSGGPVALAYNRFDVHTRHQVHEEYLASISAYRDNDGYRIPGEFVVCSGHKQAQ